MYTGDRSRQGIFELSAVAFIAYLNLYHLCAGVFVFTEPEQSLRVFPSDLQAISRVHLSVVEPCAPILEGLERIIHREQDAISTNLVFYEVQRCCGKMP